MRRLLVAAAIALSPSIALAQATSSGTVRIPDGNDKALGATSDNAWGGVGSGNLIQIMKGIYGQAIPLGTAGSASSSVMSVQGIASMTPLLIGQPLNTAIGSITSAPVIQGYVTTAAPSYTNGNVNAISLTTSGSIRAAITEGVIAAIGATNDAAYDFAGGDTTVVGALKGLGANRSIQTGTAGSPSADVLSVQGVNGGVGLKVGDAPGSSTSGVVGPISQGIVTTSAPTYTNSTINGLSLDTAGNLRVTGNFGGTAQGASSSGVQGPMVQSVTTTAAPTYSNNTVNALSTDAQGNLRVAAAGGDVCQRRPHTFTPISTVAATTQLVAGTTSKRTYICGLMLIANAAETISVVSGTGSSCTTPTAMIGNATIADGIAIAANQGFAIGSGGYAMAESTSGGTICLTKAAGVVRVSGSIVTAVEP